MTSDHLSRAQGVVAVATLGFVVSLVGAVFVLFAVVIGLATTDYLVVAAVFALLAGICEGVVKLTQARVEGGEPA